MPAKSKSQQSAAAMALQAKKGEMPVSKLKGAAKDMYDSMSSAQLRKYAKTSTKDLPQKTGEPVDEARSEFGRNIPEPTEIEKDLHQGKDLEWKELYLSLIHI